MGKSLGRAAVLVCAALVIPACGTSPDGGGESPTGVPPLGTNQPPTVRIVSPSSGTVLQSGVVVDLEVSASDPDGSIAAVQFFEGSNRLAVILTPPFRFSWIPVINGTFSLTAIATDNSGAEVASDPVSVVIQTPGTTPPTPNQPPLVRITNPLDGAVFAQGASITLSADATDPDGPSLVVEYFDGATSIGTATLIPFVVSLSGAAPGPHSIRAVATDGLGASTSSVPVSITVSFVSAPPPPSTSTNPPTGSLNGVFFANASRGWIVGELGRIWTSGDGGVTWRLQSSGTSAFLSRIQFVSTTLGWAIGVNGTILKTVDGGATWAALSSGTTETLRGLSFVNASTGWVVGDNDVILKTANGGATWTPLVSGAPNIWRAVSFVSPTIGWVGGSGAVLSTANGGSTWTVQEAILSPLAIPRSIGFNDARFVSETRGVMVGATRGGDILRTTVDGGATWVTRENTVPTNGFSAIAFGDGLHFWAVGSIGSIAASTDGGDTWGLQSSPIGLNLSAVWAVSAANAWAVGENGTVLRTINGGSTWTILNGGS